MFRCRISLSRLAANGKEGWLLRELTLAMLYLLDVPTERMNIFYLTLDGWFFSFCRLLITFINNCTLVCFNFMQLMLVTGFQLLLLIVQDIFYWVPILIIRIMGSRNNKKIMFQNHSFIFYIIVFISTQIMTFFWHKWQIFVTIT
jgi:hypothetical protein